MTAKLTDYGNSIAGLNAALRRLPKHIGVELKDASGDIAEGVAGSARAKAAAIGRGWRILGPTIRVKRSGVPTILAGGTRRIPGRRHRGERQTVGDLLFGTEFGGGERRTTLQFLPHRGTAGYALWPAVREHSDRTIQLYSRALLDALDRM